MQVGESFPSPPAFEGAGSIGRHPSPTWISACAGMTNLIRGRGELFEGRDQELLGDEAAVDY